jgi:c-di-GMP-binding flagellar brake protein YcgR
MSQPALQRPQRRRHYRVEVTLEMRMRTADPENRSREDDLVDRFAQLHSAASRFRKELRGPGRTFIDALMRTLDDLSAEVVQKQLGPAGWGPKSVVGADLSAGGVGFEWDSFQAPGTHVEIEFTVHEANSRVPFRLTGTVARCERTESGSGFEIGLEFAEANGSMQQRLVRMLLDLQRVQLRQARR